MITRRPHVDADRHLSKQDREAIQAELAERWKDPVADPSFEHTERQEKKAVLADVVDPNTNPQCQLHVFTTSIDPDTGQVDHRTVATYLPDYAWEGDDGTIHVDAECAIGSHEYEPGEIPARLEVSLDSLELIGDHFYLHEFSEYSR